MTRSNSSQRGASRSGRSTTSAQRGRAGGSSARTRARSGGATSPSPRKSRTTGAGPRASTRRASGARRTASRAASRPQAATGALFPIATIAVVALLAWAMYPALKVQYQASRSVQGLEREYEDLRERNETLRAEVADLKTAEGVERVARESLGFTRPGENVYVVVPAEAGDSSSTAAPAAADPVTKLLDAVFSVGR